MTANTASAPPILLDLDSEEAGGLTGHSLCQSRHFARIRDAIALERGLILISGPTGKGKTVLLFNALRHAVEAGRTARVENTQPLEYVEAGVEACDGDGVAKTVSDLESGRDVEAVIGVQAQVCTRNGHSIEIDTEKLGALAFIAQRRLVIAEFTSPQRLPDEIIDTLETILHRQDATVIPLHIDDRADAALEATG